MSTSNFAYRNMCVVVETSDWDDWDCDFAIENWGQQLEHKIPGFVAGKFNWDGGFGNSYPQTVIGSYDIYSKDGDHYATIVVTINSGYYADACLDYTIDRHTDGSEYTVAQRSKLESELNQVTKKVETIVSKFGKRMQRVATFSNGEFIYQPYKK